MEKYYTPELEEFYVGFEFEYSHNKINYKKQIYDGSQVLKSKSYYDDHGCEYDAVEDDLKHIRVKRLDREDIESLGWVNGEIYGMGCYLRPDKNGKAIIDGYQLVFHSWEYIEIYQESTSDIKFSGTIKNKSELKKVLKMLGI